MTCIPQSGGCERPFTDAFVEHINRTEGSQYAHRACLDHEDSPDPQPEASYIDPDQKPDLVIERKSISWPVDYPKRHNNSHIAAQQFTEELAGLPPNDLFEVRIPLLIKGTKSQMKTFALLAAKEIKRRWPRAIAGSTLKGGVDGRSWAFRKVPDCDKEEGSPSSGLMFTFEGGSMNFIDPANLPEELVSTIRDIYSRCIKKFASYPAARRVLVLDPHADLRNQGDWWWHEVFSTVTPPPEINEIWSGVFDWVDEGLEGWIFERLR